MKFTTILIPQLPMELNEIISEYIFLMKQEDIKQCIANRAHYDSYFEAQTPWYLWDRVYKRIQTHGMVTCPNSLLCLHQYDLHNRYIESCIAQFGLGCISGYHDKMYYCTLYYDCSPIEYVRKYTDIGEDIGNDEVEDWYLNWNLTDDFIL